MKETDYIECPSHELGKTQQKHIKRMVAVEMPLALCYNAIAHVVMMVTPSDIKNFILGFSISEGIIDHACDIDEIILSKNEHGIVATIWIDKKHHAKLLRRRRNLVGQTGCGLCGIEALEEAVRTYRPVVQPTRFTIEQIQSALNCLAEKQPLNQKTGAVHGAAFIDSDGIIAHLAEDVGRHNAFDKLIGKLYSKKINIASGAVILTSRCSFELVQKALAIKLPMLVTVSAPTSLAITLAKKHDLTLITLARHDTVQITNDPFDTF